MVTGAPLMSRPSPSFTVTTAVAGVTPSEITVDGLMTTVEAVALGAAAVKVTSACATSVAPTRAETVCAPVTRALTLPAVVPSGPVGPTGWTTEAAPEAASVTT